MDHTHLLGTAVALQRAGRLDDAERAFDRLLKDHPDCQDAWHFRGVLAAQRGNLEAAAEWIKRALAIRPGWPEALNNLGNVLSSLGKNSEAAECYQRAIAGNPAFAEAYYNWGNFAFSRSDAATAIACFQKAIAVDPQNAEANWNLGCVFDSTGQLEEAIASYQCAVALRPAKADYHYALGRAFQKRGRLDDALACFQKAVHLNPCYAEALHDMGVVFYERSQLADAAGCLRRAIEQVPDFGEAYNNLGLVLKEAGRLDEALSCFREAVRLEPTSSTFLNNLGNALGAAGRLEEAIAAYETALRHDSSSADIHVHLGLAHQRAGQLESAEACFETAISMQPDHARAQWSRAELMLLRGDFERGWVEYEWRWQNRQLKSRRLAQPLWDGSSLKGRTILLHAEQGFGDAIQFVRYTEMVRRQGGRVLLECHPRLIELFKCFPVDALIARGSEVPAFEVHAPLMSLPRILGTTRETIPNATPYLLADPHLVDKWRNELTALQGFRIGIAWQGDARYAADCDRSIPLRYFQAIAEVEDVSLLSLQKAHGVEQLAETRDLFSVHDCGSALDESGGAFVDSAAVMKNLDLVITSDTSIAHLAGALGVPVWVALPFIPDWRWMLARDDSPWYPTMTLFRQSTRGNWSDVFARIQQTLRGLLEERHEA